MPRVGSDLINHRCNRSRQARADRGPRPELRSVRQRREAIRSHSTYFGTGAVPSVSVVIATRRAEHVAAIVTAMAGQSYPDLELVVCLHGMRPWPALTSMLAESGRPYQAIGVPAETSFGAVLGQATARARGTLLAKVDDDDSYGPEHIWDLVIARHYSGATMVGKGAEFVYLEDGDVTVRRWSGRPESEDTFVAGGTMLIGKSIIELVTGSPCRAVGQALHSATGRRLVPHAPLGYLYHRRARGHTWDPGQEYFLRNTRARWDGRYLPDPGPVTVA
jgi:hypothetical protein